MQSSYQLIAISHLKPGRYQPRKTFDDESIQALAQSIKTQGLLEPLLVRALTQPFYEIIAGERRWRAMMLTGHDWVPCLVGDYSDEQVATIALVENIQREDLNLIEEAQGYQRLMEEFSLSQQDIADKVGKSRSHIANLTRLLSLCDSIQSLISQQKISLGHARMLVGMPPHTQREWAHRIFLNGWSVRQLEKAIRATKSSPLASLSPDNTHLQNALSDYIGSPVKIIEEHEQSGWISIKYFDHDTLSGLLERIGLRYSDS